VAAQKKAPEDKSFGAEVRTEMSKRIELDRQKKPYREAD
jgi:hypothetical protein